MKILVVLMVVMLVMVGCVGDGTTPDPTPTQEVGEMGAGFTVLNTNPHLNGPVRTETGDWVEQYRPELHYMISEPGTAEGYLDEYSGNAPVAYENGGYVFDIWLKNGEWGFGLPLIAFSEGCKAIKVLGSSIVNSETPEDHMVKAYLRLADSDSMFPVGSMALPEDGSENEDFEAFWVFNVNSPIVLSPQVVVVSAWGSALDESNAVVRTIYVADAPIGYCTPDVLQVN